MFFIPKYTSFSKNFNIFNSFLFPPILIPLSWIGMPFCFWPTTYLFSSSKVTSLWSLCSQLPFLLQSNRWDPAFTPHAHLYPALNSHFIKVGWLACLLPPLGCKHYEKVVFFFFFLIYISELISWRSGVEETNTFF